MSHFRSTARRRGLLPSWLGLLLVAAGVVACRADDARASGPATEPHALDVRPEIACRASRCAVRLALTEGGRTLRSDPLPFGATSAQLEEIPVDGRFGVGDPGGRSFRAWAIGREEQSIGVAVEAITLGPSRGLLVHEVAGFEHVKRAHVVLEITAVRLATRLVAREGAGPEFLEMWPEGNAVTVRRTGPEAGSRPTLTRYRWDSSGAEPALVPLDAPRPGSIEGG